MKNPLVSVITPSYNCENTISKTIESVINQSFSNWEMIIVDDCSSDTTIEIVRNYASNDSRIKLVERQWNAGPAIARNVAIENAQGR
ncbi:glycosyltransferase family 2 protein, partial [Photobacterium damselae]|nr:glycosyltransferase family 2 protein [Photobacterium damselae]